MPAKAGIQKTHLKPLDSGFRRNDEQDWCTCSKRPEVVFAPRAGLISMQISNSTGRRR